MVARFARRDHGENGHVYTLNAERIPGVTTALDTLNKPLKEWAAKVTANYAVDHWAELAAMTPTARQAVLVKAHRATLKGAATRGTRVHSFGVALLMGEAVTVPDELLDPVQAYARFLDEWELAPLHAEMPVCHLTYRYGGTLDAIGASPKLGTCIWDIKTGGVYDEVALQLAAYRHADFGIGADGNEVILSRLDIERAFVAKVHPDSVELIPVTADEAVWRAFLYVLTVYRWKQSLKEAPVIGRAISPEAALTQPREGN